MRLLFTPDPVARASDRLVWPIPHLILVPTALQHLTAWFVALTGQSRASSRASECSDDGEGSLASTSPHSAAQSIRAASWAVSGRGSL